MLTTPSAPGAGWGTLLTTWHTTWGVEVVLTALAALYLRTALHVGGWPVMRTVSAMGALAVVVVTVDSGIGAAAPRTFSVGVVMQLLLTLVVPALWVAGRPLELLRRGSSTRVAAGLDRISDALAHRTFPPVVLVVYALVLVLARLTTFPVAAATSPLLSVLGPLLWLGAGLLLVGTTLRSGRPAAGFLVLLGALVVTAAVGLVLDTVPADLVPTFPPDDVRRGGTILWAGGGALVLVITAVAGRRWAGGRSGTATAGSGGCPVR